CSAYERDVSACLAYLQGEGDRARGGERDAPARLPGQRAHHAAGGVEPGADDGGAEVLLPLPGRGGAAAARPGAAAADAEEGRRASGRPDDGRARTPAHGDRPGGA